MRIDVLTLFPAMFSAYLGESILQRAQQAGRIAMHVHNIRDYAEGKHHVTDEPPYGGGGGMILKPQPIFDAVENLAGEAEERRPKIILLSPQGRLLTHDVAQALAAESWLLFLCGRYEGIDERVREHLVDEELSIGDYVLTGGELPAAVIIDAVARLIPGPEPQPAWNIAMAGGLVALLPPVLVVLVMQHWFVKGLVDTEK